MPDENIVTVGESIAGEVAQTGYKKRFSEELAYKAYDRYLVQEMRLADRLRQIAIFKDAGSFLKDTATKVLPGDIPELQVLFEIKRLYGEARGIEDLAERLKIQAKNLDQVSTLLMKLSARQKEAMDFIEQVMARKAKNPDNELTPEEIRNLAKEA